MELEQVLERAHSLGEEGDWEAMASLLRELLADHDAEPAVHCWLGVAERELGMDGVAYERFKRAVALDPQDPYVLATAGNGIAMFDDEDAERVLRAAALTAPRVPLTRLMYGAYLSREGFHQEGITELRAAQALAADDAPVAYQLGLALARAGDLDGAADSIGDAVRLDPGDAWVRLVFGLVLLEAGRLEEATGELLSAARLAEAHLDAQLAAALAAAATGRDGVAHEMLERARLSSDESGLALVAEVEDLLDSGTEASAAMLREDVGPNLLRTHLQELP